jgi:ubiquinone/menaquinone biosynthesis C-methylase UbiE
MYDRPIEMKDSERLDAVNRAVMGSRQAIDQYSRTSTLSAAEAAALASIAGEARSKPILDIGVGGGRTVSALLDVSGNYLGVDYSVPMIRAVKHRFPAVKFRHADARNLAFLADASIYLAVFSCNGIGMVGHEDRLAILREVRRILMPGGAFLFSTHNKHCPDHDGAFKFPIIERSANPAKLAMRGARFARQTAARIYNRWRLRDHGHRTEEYSIVNDECHDYGVLLYYITLDAQRRQLEEVGFRAGATAFDLDGREITSDNPSTDSSITLLARA